MSTVKAHQRKDGARVRSHERRASRTGERGSADPDAAAAAAAETDGTLVKAHDRRGPEAAAVGEAAALTARAEAGADAHEHESPTDQVPSPVADGVPADAADRYVQAMSALRRVAGGPAVDENVREAVACNRSEAIHQLNVMEQAAAWNVGDGMAAERRGGAEEAWRALWASADAHRDAAAAAAETDPGHKGRNVPKAQCIWAGFYKCGCGSTVTQGVPDGENPDEVCVRAIRCDRTGQVLRTLLM